MREVEEEVRNELGGNGDGKDDEMDSVNLKGTNLNLEKKNVN